MKLTETQISESIDPDRFPAVLTPEQTAELFQVSVATVYRWSSEGRFSGSVRRGRPLRFWRDGLITSFFAEKPASRGWRRRGPGGRFSARAGKEQAQ